MKKEKITKPGINSYLHKNSLLKGKKRFDMEGARKSKIRKVEHESVHLPIPVRTLFAAPVTPGVSIFTDSSEFNVIFRFYFNHFTNEISDGRCG